MIRSLVIVIIGFLCLTAAARAENMAETYLVTNIPANVSDSNPMRARDVALAAATKFAFKEILKRLDLNPTMIKEIQPDDLDALIQTFEVQNEKISAKYYSGIFNIQFKPQMTYDFLVKKDVISGAGESALLILPVVKKNGRTILWEEDTDWYTIWSAEAQETPLIPMTVPEASLENIATISPAEIIAGNAVLISKLIKNNQSTGAVVLLLDQSAPTSNASLPVTITRYNKDGNMIDTLQTSIPSTSEIEDLLASIIAPNPESPSNSIITNTPSPSINSSPATANHTEGRLSVTIPIQNLNDWRIIQSRLRQIPFITQITPVTMSPHQVDIDLEYDVDFDSLLSIMASRGFVIGQNNNNWVLQSF